MLTLKDLLEDNVDWDEVEIDDEEFERLSTELIIDFLKKHGTYERQQLLTSWNFDNGKEVLQLILTTAAMIGLKKMLMLRVR